MTSTTESFQERFMRQLNQMHFDSQPKAAQFYQITLIVVAIISYIIAFFLQRFSICIYAMIVATVVCVLIVVPGQWPWWRRPLPQFAKEKAK